MSKKWKDYDRAHRWASKYIRKRYPEEGENVGNGPPSGSAWWGAFEAYQAGLRAGRRERASSTSEAVQP